MINLFPYSGIPSHAKSLEKISLRLRIPIKTSYVGFEYILVFAGVRVVFAFTISYVELSSLHTFTHSCCYNIPWIIHHSGIASHMKVAIHGTLSAGTSTAILTAARNCGCTFPFLWILNATLYLKFWNICLE